MRLCLCALSQCEQALAKEAKRKQEEEKSRLEEMKRQEKKALEEADAARFRGKEAKEPKTLTQFQIYEQKTQREAQARAMARQEVRARAGRRAHWRLMLAPGPERQVHGVVGRAGAREVAGRMMAAFYGITEFCNPPGEPKPRPAR